MQRKTSNLWKEKLLEKLSNIIREKFESKYLIHITFIFYFNFFCLTKLVFAKMNWFLVIKITKYCGGGCIFLLLAINFSLFLSSKKVWLYQKSHMLNQFLLKLKHVCYRIDQLRRYCLSLHYLPAQQFYF